MLSLYSSSVSDPFPRVDDAAGKVAAVSSAHKPTTAVEHVWFQLHDDEAPELGPAMGALVVVVVVFRTLFVVGGADEGEG